jgi:glycosyltransferase involved in cell wall biosynthesis
MSLTVKRPEGMTVAIVITTYNQAHFLADAITSALRQTVAAAEIIVIDDGSTDDPAAVAALFAPVRLVRQVNAGLSAARNAGLRQVTSGIVIFLDADDRLTPLAVQAAIEGLAEDPAALMTYGGYRVISPDGSPASDIWCEDLGADPYATLMARGNLIGMHATVAYRSAHLRRIGGFDEELRACEDLDVYLRLSSEAVPRRHGRFVAEYRHHSDNMSRDKRFMMVSVRRVYEKQVMARPEMMSVAEVGVSTIARKYAPEIGMQAAIRILRTGFNRHDTGLVLQSIREVPFVVGALALRRIAIRIIRRLPAPVQRLVGVRPALGKVNFGDFHGTEPIGGNFGYDRGLPVDRHYIEQFLGSNADAIKGRVLEIGDNEYTLKFGRDQVTKSDILHYTAVNPKATFVGDLADPNLLPAGTFDCIIITQTLQFLFDLATTFRNIHNALAPGGVFLCTVPGITSVDPWEWPDSWYWSFTDSAMRRLLKADFHPDEISIQNYGNVFASVAFLEGLALDEVPLAKLTPYDPRFPMIIGTRSRRRPSA